MCVGMLMLNVRVNLRRGLEEEVKRKCPVVTSGSLNRVATRRVKKTKNKNKIKNQKK